MDKDQIIALLPYTKPFLFVDGLENISENGCAGHYTFQEDEYFYEGHFKNQAVTPGVILTECMAQIGVVCLGIFLMGKTVETTQKPEIALTSHQMDFFIPVFPGETVRVDSTKEVFRFNKLRCKVQMHNAKGELVPRGNISGMVKA